MIILNFYKFDHKLMKLIRLIFPSISEFGPWSGEILIKGSPIVMLIASKL